MIVRINPALWCHYRFSFCTRRRCMRHAFWKTFVYYTTIAGLLPSSLSIRPQRRRVRVSLFASPDKQILNQSFAYFKQAICIYLCICSFSFSCLFFSLFFSFLIIISFCVLRTCVVFNLTLPYPEESKLLFVPKAAEMIKIKKHQLYKWKGICSMLFAQ